jgi:hypothetical protein
MTPHKWRSINDVTHAFNSRDSIRTYHRALMLPSAHLCPVRSNNLIPASRITLLTTDLTLILQSFFHVRVAKECILGSFSTGFSGPRGKLINMHLLADMREQHDDYTRSSIWWPFQMMNTCLHIVHVFPHALFFSAKYIYTRASEGDFWCLLTFICSAPEAPWVYIYTRKKYHACARAYRHILTADCITWQYASPSLGMKWSASSSTASLAATRLSSSS